MFRVEQLFGDRRAAARAKPAGVCAVEGRKAGHETGAGRATAGDNIRRELERVHDMLARNHAELGALIGENKSRRMARATGELGAAVDGMEKATHNILQAAEAIDDSAKSLGAALKDDFERSLAQDIQDRTVQVYEACNFQDLAGQRIAKVIEIILTPEEQLAAMLARCAALTRTPEDATAAEPADNGLLNGPKLDGDPGHASQADNDAIIG
ncbi:MAG: protein phosphatase CheZ [Pseudolabrys sp.]